jgi:CO/xanthine dehydrogenase Mo-binding subunit
LEALRQHMGGGFGSQQIAWKHTVIAALLSKQAGRPVQLMLDREAENLAAGNRNATRQHTADGPKRRGIGIAAHDWGGSGYSPAYAWVKLNGDGTAEGHRRRRAQRQPRRV